MVRNRERIAQLARIKGQVTNKIIYDIERRRLTRKDVQFMTGIHPSNLSEILNKKVHRFSMDYLLLVLFALGHSPTVRIN